VGATRPRTPSELVGGSLTRVAGLMPVLAVVLVALNLRPAITSVGPLLGEVQDTFGAPATWAGLLTTVPVLCFAGAGLATPALARRIGTGGAVRVALVALIAGLVLRVSAGPEIMIGGTVLAAAGIAVLGVLVPVVVRASFPTRVGAMTGVYTAALQTGATIGFALASPLESTLGGWRPALASWALLAAVALLAWTGIARTAPEIAPVRDRPTDRPALLRSPLAWAVTAFFGLQAFVAFAVMGWLPQVLMDAGTSRGAAGLLLGLLSIVALPISLVVPPLAARRGGQSGWIVGLSGCGFVGAGGFLLVPALAPLLWTVLLGLGMSVFSLALTVIALRARDGADTAALSGMAQGLGYVLAGTGPFVFGTLHELTGGWTAPLTVLLVVIGLQAVMGAVAGRPRHVR
jgi:MFS transporter, CP family, cyanate transporter